jgi:PEP-CTERM motif-containing protein
MKSRVINFALICSIAAWAPTVAHASLIDGSELQISGNFVIGAIAWSWLCNQPGDSACTSPPAGAGDFAVSGSTGSFAEYNGTFGLAQDLNDALEPLNTAFSLPNFLTFDLNNDLTVELTFIPLGNDTASTTCAGLPHCTPENDLLITPTNPLGLSMFNLDSNLDGTALTFGVQGVVHQAGGATADLSGTYTSEFLGLNPQQTLALADGGSAFTYSTNLSLAVAQTNAPEPTSIFLSGLGLVGLGLVRRVRRS